MFVHGGSVFQVRIPLVEPGAETLVLQEEYRIARFVVRFRSPLILVVDDIDYNRALVKSFLEPCNARFIEAENGSEAITSAIEFMPDVILMDLRMPVMNGYEAAERIKSDERTRAIPIVALTANASAKDRDQCIEAGMDDYLTKPIRSVQLAQALSTYISTKRAA